MRDTRCYLRFKCNHPSRRLHLKCKGPVSSAGDRRSPTTMLPLHHLRQPPVRGHHPLRASAYGGAARMPWCLNNLDRDGHIQ